MPVVFNLFGSFNSKYYCKVNEEISFRNDNILYDKNI